MATRAARPLTRTDVLTTREVADLLGIPRSTVHELARRGDLPARRVGRRRLFLRDRLAAAITPLDDPAAWQPPRNDPQEPPSATPRRTSQGQEAAQKAEHPAVAGHPKSASDGTRTRDLRRDRPAL